MSSRVRFSSFESRRAAIAFSRFPTLATPFLSFLRRSASRSVRDSLIFALMKSSISLLAPDLSSCESIAAIVPDASAFAMRSACSCSVS